MLITAFAAQAAPPQPAFDRAIMNVIAAIAALVIAPAAWRDLAGHPASWLSPLLAAIVAFTLYKLAVAAKNRPQDQARRNEWERSWI